MTAQNLKIKKGKVIAVSISKTKGIRKSNVKSAVLRKDFGIITDAHGGGGNRQVSLLADESIEKMQAKGLKVGPGDFAENITTQGLSLANLKVGAKLKVGRAAVLEISQIGKVCQKPCSIYYQAGDCVMPREGIFAKVIKGGLIKPQDTLEVIENV